MVKKDISWPVWLRRASQTGFMLLFLYLFIQAAYHPINRLGGRVGFLWLDADQGGGTQIDLEGRPGVLGRGDRFVETQPRFAPLAKRLLGQTWFVEKLSHALQLANSVGRGLRFVTLSGELLR